MKRIIGLRGVASALLVVSSIGLFSTAVIGASSSSAASSTFVIGTVNSVQKLDPDIVTNFLDFEALGLIYNTLVQENANLQIVPDLATSWAFSNGNKTLTLHLRQNVKFDDGSTMTSATSRASTGCGRICLSSRATWRSGGCAASSGRSASSSGRCQRRRRSPGDT